MTDSLLKALRAYSFTFTTEGELQRGIAAALAAAGIDHQREVNLGDSSRIDFMVGRVGVEVKINGTPADLIRQVHRYAQFDELDEILVVTSRMKLAFSLPKALNGKRVHSLCLAGDAL